MDETDVLRDGSGNSVGSVVPGRTRLERIASEASAAIDWAWTVRRLARHCIGHSERGEIALLVSAADTLEQTCQIGPRPSPVEARNHLSQSELAEIDAAFRSARERGGFPGLIEAADRFAAVFETLLSDCVDEIDGRTSLRPGPDPDSEPDPNALSVDGNRVTFRGETRVVDDDEAAFVQTFVRAGPGKTVRPRDYPELVGDRPDRTFKKLKRRFPEIAELIDSDTTGRWLKG